MSKYPYTYCADYLRMIGPQDDAMPILSRADASIMKSRIAEALGMNPTEFSSKMADAYMRHYGLERA